MTYITMPDADLTAVSAFDPPVDGPLFWNYFDSLLSLRRNLAYDEPWSKVVGAPAMTSAGNAVALNGGTNYIISPVADRAAATIFAVAGPPPGSNGNFYIVSTNGADGKNGAGLVYSSQNQTIAMTSGRAGNTTVNANLFSFAPTGYTFVTGRIDQSNTRIDLNLTGATQQGFGAAARDVTTGFFRFGSDYTQSGAAAVPLAFAAIYPRWLTDAECALVYARVKKRMATLQISV